MAKVSGPLMSFDASGSIGKLINYTSTTGGKTVRGWAKPTGTPNAVQVSRRNRYREGAAAWQVLTPEGQAAYNTTAAPQKLTGYNLFIRAWLTPWPPVGTIWDDGATTWDSGATVWDT